jgi:2-iminoacetate synthase
MTRNKMISKELDRFIQRAEEVVATPSIGQNSLLSLLEKSASGAQLDEDEIVNLLRGTYEEKNRETILEFARQYSRPHDKEILLLPPLYFSSICENDCLYCDFSSNGNRLTEAEFLAEFNTLLDLGYRSVELVSSQDPDLYVHQKDFSLDQQLFQIDPVLNYFKIAHDQLNKNGGGMLTSNIPPVDVESFKRLKAAGLECYLIWLETFNPEQYARLHKIEGPKASRIFRANSFAYALDAGLEHLAGAFLKGLYDWRKEEVVLYLMDDYLKKIYGRGFSIIGTPRLKGQFQKSPLVASFSVSDQDYELNVALDRILFDGILWLQTRETFSTNRRLIKKFGGGIILTLTSCTAPGGYSKPPKGRAQFPVQKQKLNNSVKNLEEDGFTVIFDWNAKTLTEFQRLNGGQEPI